MKAELYEVSEARIAFYEFLSGLYYRELTQEQIDHLRQVSFTELCTGDETLAQGGGLISHYLHTSMGDTRLDLAADYAYSILAVGTYDARRAVPYESVFTSEEGSLMQDARDDVYRRFCEEHLGVRKGLDVPEDHLSFMFDYMVALGKRFMGALDEDDYAQAKKYLDLQASFHEKHLINWIDGYCDVFDNTAQTDFYRGVSLLTRGWIHHEGETLKDMISLMGELYPQEQTDTTRG